ncbi:hypothetical protein [Geobacter sp. SVR]|uniref:hypothetical protein n=1 Tax=Geobacter sp. SVR TaxID=2495594 RepID=UPI00143EFB15|nr:hypothetical protein [Geobacter sp. SVR]BCS52542.1 hypothetical protein GSVR_08500 [Geobacter sp. SVR]GCF84021.1 hypothetical protein GSbR_06210 [Geobacter sp. SVR]
MSYLNKLHIGTMTIMVLAAGATLSGCAGVTFYSESTLEKETGIPIYASKPYLLVSRTGAKDKPVEVSIVYLNDPSKVIYAKPHSGFGSNNLTLALANGQMTSFGQQTDTKVPELIAALGGLATSSSTATKTLAEAAQIRSSIGTKQSTVSLVEAGNKIGVISDDMLAKISAHALPGLTDSELQTVKSAAQALKSAATALSNPADASAAHYLDQVKAHTDSLSTLPVPTASTSRDSSLQIVQAWAVELSKILNSAQPEKEAPPAFELYEIIQNNGTTTLRRVNP